LCTFNVGIQKYKDDVSLSDQEVGKIAAWADSGLATAEDVTFVVSP
jgi:hypothetical protein